MFDETRIGGVDGRFPRTRWTAVAAARSPDAAQRRRALDTLVSAYWKPIYKHLRARWRRSNEDAKDLTQEFFSCLIEKDFLESFDPSKARLRTFLRTCVDRLVQNEDRAARRLKRGGGGLELPLDFDGAEAELARAGESPPDAEQVFEREWVRSLFGVAVVRLEEECRSRGKESCYRLFELYDLADDERARPTYRELAERLEMPATDVTNKLAWARREFRRITLDVLREITASDQEFSAEAFTVLGVRVP